MGSIPRLTDLETMIMKVLWEHDRGLTIQEITASITEKTVSVASVAQAIKHMLTKQAVKVGEHVPVSNVYARTFYPCFRQKEFLATEFRRMQEAVFGTHKHHTVEIAAAFLSAESPKNMELEELEELQKIIDEKKEILKNKDK